MTKGAPTSTNQDSPSEKTKIDGTSTQSDSPSQELTGLSTSSITASADTTPPAQVTGLVIRTVSSTLNLAWTKVTASDFNHYNVYRGTSSGFTVTPGVTVPTGTSTTNSYSNTGLSPSTKYYYKVAAVDNAGNIGLICLHRYQKLLQLLVFNG